MDPEWWWFMIVLYTFIVTGIILLVIFYPLRALDAGPTGPSGTSGIPGTPGGTQGLLWGLPTVPQTPSSNVFITTAAQITDVVDPGTALVTYSDLVPYNVSLQGFVIHGKFINNTPSSKQISGQVYQGDTSYLNPGNPIGDAYVSTLLTSGGTLLQASFYVPFTYPFGVAQGERLGFYLQTNGCTIDSLSIALVWL